MLIVTTDHIDNSKLDHLFIILVMLLEDAHGFESHLNSASSQCARGKSSIARKPEDHPKIFKWLKAFQKCNHPDFKFYPSRLTDKIFPHMV